MSNTILLSVRIDKWTMDRIDKFTKRVYYWKRNAVINQLLTALMESTNEHDLDMMLRYSRYVPNSKIKISVTLEVESGTEKPP